MIITNEHGSEKSIKTDTGKIILLYKKLLETMEIEQLEIAEHNLMGIEHCFSLKKSLISELKALSNGKPCNSEHESSGSILTGISTKRAEIESLIKKIAVINEANAKAVLHLKNKAADAISALQREKTAFRAYGASA